MKNQVTFLLCAACLAMTACGKTTDNVQDSLTEEITTISEVTDSVTSKTETKEKVSVTTSDAVSTVGANDETDADFACAASQLIGSLDNKEQVAYFERNGSVLAAYVDDTNTSYVVYCDADGNAELLYNQQGPMGAAVECYSREKFAPYQSFDNTVYILDDAAMGVGQLIKTWYLTSEGKVIDLADTIDFETENKGLYISSTVVNGTEKKVIGLREYLSDTDKIGASQLLAVTLENEKIVKLAIEPII